MDKVACKGCGSLILPTTYQKNNGFCLLCVRGITKDSCDICNKEVTVLTQINGKKICLNCNNKLSTPLTELWKNLCKEETNPFEINKIQIKPYPEFEEVFIDNSLKGFYYPLCTLKINDQITGQIHIFHVLSNNGLWLDGNKSSSKINSNYSVFKRIENKYTSDGNVIVFLGHKYVKELFQFLEQNFDEKKHTKANELLEDVIKNYPIDMSSFDYEYYIETFFDYRKHKSKLKREIKEDGFIQFEKIKKLNLFNGYNHKDFINEGEEIIVNEKHFENKADLINKIPIGCCWIDQYFSDGNNTFVFFDKENDQIYCVNQYS